MNNIMHLIKATLLKPILFSLVMVFLWLQNISAQPLSELIEMAGNHNPGMHALNIEYEAAQHWADQKDDYPDPQINVGIGILPVETRLGAQRLKIGLSQPIPWKGLLNARAELATSKADALANLGDEVFLNIEYAIRNAYAQLIRIEGKIAVIRKKLISLDALESLAKSAVRSGKGKLSNVLFVERTRDMLESNIMILEKEKESPSISINRWTGQPINQSIKIVFEESDERVDPSAEDISSYPGIKTLEAKKEISQKSLELIAYEKKPSIGVGLDYSLISARPDLEIDHNGRDVLMPMGTISIPLNTSRFKAKRQEELLIQEALDLRIANLNEHIKSEIAAARSKIELAEIENQKYLKLKEITSETLRLLRTEYASEGTRFEELIRLEMELIDYDEGMIQAEYLKNLAIATLNKYK